MIIIIVSDVCDHHHSDYPQAAALTRTEQGSLIRRRRRGDNVSAFWDIFGKICDDADTEVEGYEDE